jgi:hypothetical protein
MINGVLRHFGLILVLAALGGHLATAENVGAALTAMTGAHTRVVWLRQTDKGSHPNLADHDGTNAQYALMGFDSEDGKERQILPGPRSYANPWLTYDGLRIIFSDTVNRALCIVDWNGKNLKQLVRDDIYFGLCYWIDPENGDEWAYLSDHYTWNDPERNGPDANWVRSCAPGHGVYRIRLDEPKRRETVWTKTTVEVRFRLSADGKFAGGGFPWPNAGVLNLADGTLTQVGQGCVTNLAPDNSYRLFHMTGSHKDLAFYDAGGANQRLISLVHNAPDFGSGCAWAPKWSNDVRFITMCGPFPRGHWNYAAANIYFGKFNEPFTGLEWLRLTHVDAFETSAYAWIEQAGVRFGPVDGLQVTRLQAQVAKLRRAKNLEPLVKELRVLAEGANAEDAAEAKGIIAHLEQWVQDRLASARGQEAEAPDHAQAIYQSVATRYHGLSAGDEAEARLKDPVFERNCRAWACLSALRAEERELVDGGGGQRSAKDQRWAALNKPALEKMVANAKKLKQTFAGTSALELGLAILKKYDLE